MNQIVISEEDYLKNGKEILIHEQAHIACRHSWDVIWLSVVEIIQWFNPLVWMLSKDMIAIHEYEADRIVLQNDIDAMHYQFTLIAESTKEHNYLFVNRLHASQVKQRIAMMNHKASTHKHQWKYLYLLPLIGIGMAVYAQKHPVVVQGHVTDEYGKEIINASVIIPQAFTGTITDSEGCYLLLAGKEDVIHIGMPGYESRFIALKDCPIQNGRITLNVELLTNLLAELI